MEKESFLSKKISRRTLLASSALASAGLVAACGESKLSKISKEIASRPAQTSEPIPTKETEQFQLLWQQGLRRGKYSWLENYRIGRRKINPFLAGVDGVYLTNSSGQFTKLDTETGAPLWPVSWENAGTPLIEAGGFVAVAREDVERFYILKSDTGEEFWRYKADGKLDRVPIIFDNLIYFIDRASGAFFKAGEIDPQKSTVGIWQPTAADEQKYGGIYGLLFDSYGDFLTITDKRVVLSEGGFSELLFGLDRQTWNTVWVTEANMTSMALTPEKIVYEPFTGGAASDLIVIDILTGTEQRFNILKPYAESFRGSVLGNKAVIYENYNHSIKTFDLVTGEFSPSVPASEILGNFGEVLYLSPRSDSVVAYHTSTNQVLWENDEVLPKQLLAASDSEVFIFDNQGNIVALNSQTGARLWKFEFGASISEPLLTDEALIFGTSQVFILDRKTGGYAQPPIPVSNPVVQIHQKEKKIFVESSETLTVLG